MIRVLHVLTGAHTGGISSTVLNIYKAIIGFDIHFDLAITKKAIGINGKKFIEMGSSIFLLPPKSKKPFEYIKGLQKILSDNHYDVIHVHENLTSFVALAVAKKNGIPIRIAHAHTAIQYKTVFDRIRQLLGHVLMPRYASHLIACSTEAGDVIFGKRKNVIIINNGVDIEKYKFEEQMRKRIREEWNVNNEFVIGTVGRLSAEKNHLSLLRIFAEYHSKNHNSKLVIVGDGPLKDSIVETAKRMRIDDCTLLLGTRSNVNELLQGFDVFLLPSIFEGFPLSVAEALSSGLDVLMSDTITKDYCCFDEVHYCANNNQFEWVEKISRIETSHVDRVGRNAMYLGTIIDSKKTFSDLLIIYRGEKQNMNSDNS